MSHVDRMKNLDKLDKLLQQNPHGIRIINIAKKLDVDRSTVYRYLESKDLQGKARYERGTAYPGKPKLSTEQKPSPKSFGFFGLLERRAERKRLEKERRILDLNIEFYALREEILMDEDKYNSEAPEQHARRRQKYRKILEGSQKN